MGADSVAAVLDGYSFGPFSIDVRQSRILESGKPVRWWSKKRFELLRVLLEANGDVVHYDDLVEKVWSGKDITFHTVNKTANDLRRCLGMFGDCVQNKHSVGFYFLRPPAVPAQRLEPEDPLDLAARAQYGVAVEEWNRRTEASLQRAVNHFRRVSQAYPRFVPALLGLADCLLLLSHGGFPVFQPKDALPEAKKSIELALAQADSDTLAATAHAMLGKLQLMYEWDWCSAERNLNKAVSLDSRHAPAHHVLAHILLITNRSDECLAAIVQARKLSPISPMIHSTSGWLRHFLGRNQEAVSICREAIELHPEFAAGYAMLAVAYQGAGMMKEAVDAFESSRALHSSPNAIAGLGYLHGVSGRPSRARACLKRLATLAQTGSIVSPYFFALVYTGLGEIDRAIHCLVVAEEQRFDWLIHVGVEPRWKPLRADRRFRALLSRIGLQRLSRK